MCKPYVQLWDMKNFHGYRNVIGIRIRWFLKVERLLLLWLFAFPGTTLLEARSHTGRCEIEQNEKDMGLCEQLELFNIVTGNAMVGKYFDFSMSAKFSGFLKFALGMYSTQQAVNVIFE
ncbi:hypothetical protein PV325_006506 [Microctonus aethiopoides]|nr:hypothetical protein PV325_006506 [Microctonus aethiopoides]